MCKKFYVEFPVVELKDGETLKVVTETVYDPDTWEMIDFKVLKAEKEIKENG